MIQHRVEAITTGEQVKIVALTAGDHIGALTTSDRIGPIGSGQRIVQRGTNQTLNRIVAVVGCRTAQVYGNPLRTCPILE